MSLQYKILWFEDNEEIVEDHKDDITAFLEELGLELLLTHQEDGQNLDNLLEKDDYDLILTDLNLGEGDTGDKLIDSIRSHNVLTEVLFYSGNATGINEVIRKHDMIERASFSVGLENLLTKIRQLISLTIRKLQEVNTVRGLVMAETSHLDIVMLEVLQTLFNTYDEDEKSIKKQELMKKTVENRQGRFLKIQKTTLDEFDQFCLRLESSDRLNAIIRLIKHKNKEGDLKLKENLEVINNYREEIIDVRNSLAHAKEEVVDGQKKVISSLTQKEIQFDDESCKAIRKSIRKHTDNFNKVILKTRGLL